MVIKSKFRSYTRFGLKGLFFVILALILISIIDVLTKEGFNSAGLTLLFKYFLIYVFLGVSLIPGVYLFCWIIIKLENNKFLDSLPIEIQLGFSLALCFILIILYIGTIAIIFGPLISPNLFKKPPLNNFIEMIIVSIVGSFFVFLMGVVTGFIIRIQRFYNK